MKLGRAWAVKCTERTRDAAEGWHWKRYFPPTSSRDPDKAWENWGGDDLIRDSRSLKFLWDEVAAGDLAVCYQSDDPVYGRAVLGLARFASRGKEQPPGSGRFNCFDLLRPE